MISCTLSQQDGDLYLHRICLQLRKYANKLIIERLKCIDTFRIVELIVGQEIFRILVRIDLDLCERIVNGGDLVALSNTTF